METTLDDDGMLAGPISDLVRMTVEFRKTGVKMMAGPRKSPGPYSTASRLTPGS